MGYRKRCYALSLLFLMGTVCMYGCSYQEGAFVHEKPPYYHGHVEDEPGPRHESMHQRGETKTVYETSETKKVFSTTRKEYGVVSVEKDAPAEIQVGKPFTYTIKINNLTGGKIKDVEVTETFSHKYELKGSIPKVEKEVGEGRAKWFIGDLNQAETKLIRITGVPLETGDMPFCTDVTYNLPPLCSITNAVEPKLTISKSAPKEILICDTIPISIVVTNTGTGIAQNLQVKESLSPGLRTADGKSDIVQDIGILKPGETREIAFTVKADKTGKFSNTATVVAEGGLKAESNTVTTIVRQPILAIKKRGPEKIYTGKNITYNIDVNNKGDGPAASATIEDVIPGNASFISASQGGVFSGNTVIWNLGTLQPRDSRKVSVTLKDKGLGIVKNIATVKAVCAAPVSASATTDVLGIAAILLEVIDTADPIEVGNNETYVIMVTNQGSETGTNIKVVCMLEDTMQYVSSSGPTTGTISVDGKTVIFDPLPTLASKAKASWKVVVKALDAGDVRFKVNMIEDCLTRPVEETEATNFYK